MRDGRAQQEPEAQVAVARRGLDAAGGGRDRAARVLGAIAGAARAHWLFLFLFAAGAALRGVTLLAYRPALFGPDSLWYLELAGDLRPAGVRPVGYSGFLRILPLEHGLAVVPFVQHLLGLGIAVLLYALLLRLGVRDWLAALASAPVLLDAYQLNIEQQILSETLFEVLVVGACALLLWRSPLGAWWAGLAGLLFGAAAVTRPIGVLVFAVALVTVLFLRGRPSRWLSAAAAVAAFALPLGGYAVWFHAEHGEYAVSTFEGRFLYGRVVRFADCSEFAFPRREEPLCPPEGGWGEERSIAALLWSDKASPIRRIEPPPGQSPNDVAGSFAKRAIRNQPLAYAKSVGRDFLLSYGPAKEGRAGDFGVEQWRFQPAFPIMRLGSLCAPPSGEPGAGSRPCPGKRQAVNEVIRANGGDRPVVDGGLASFLRAYQRVAYAWGPLLGVALLVGLAAALGLGRARRSGLRAAAFLFAGAGLAVSLGSVAVTVFSWRYQLPLVVLLPPAFALGVTALTAARRGEAPPDAPSTGDGRAASTPAEPGTHGPKAPSHRAISAAVSFARIGRRGKT